MLYLDKDHKRVPIGVFGQLFIGGKGVYSRYWELPDLTNAKFDVICHTYEEKGEIRIATYIILKKPNSSIDFKNLAKFEV